MWVKICGITNERELEDALEAKPDALGFVVETDGSRHSISKKRAESLMGRVPSSVSKVAVSLNASILEEVSLFSDYVQVYEPPPPIKCGVIRGFLFSEIKDEEGIEEDADMIMIDSGHGSGVIHDWGFTARIKKRLRKPMILAGGLNPLNVEAAIRRVEPYGVDVSSGVEARGKKDLALMKTFVRKARREKNEK